MKKEEIEKCTQLAKKCLSLKPGPEQDQMRNELYCSLQSPMIKWIQSILAQKGIYWESGEILSESWLCFEFCLRYFKPDEKIPLPNHFFSYAKFYIAMLQNNLRKTNTLQSEFKDDLPYIALRQTDLYGLYEELDELRLFRQILPVEYHSIFDDAIMSMVGCLNDRVRRLNETPVKYYRYCESKKIFRILIAYLLKR